MFTAYIVVTVMAAIANAFSAALDFVRYQQILIAMDKAGVPQSWLTTLGILKAAGALGLLVGIVVPPIGIAAAVGLTLFFVAAIVTHLRVRDYSVGLAAVFLLLAVAALGLRLASSRAGLDPGFGGLVPPMRALSFQRSAISQRGRNGARLFPLRADR
jgi:hypothetical protein